MPDRWVAVATDNHIITSDDDGQTWTTRASPFGSTSRYTDVAYGQSKFVAALEFGQIAYSAEGESWSIASEVLNEVSGDSVWAVDFGSDGAADLWVATLANRRVYHSGDGQTWAGSSITLTDHASGVAIQAIHYGGVLWVVGGNHGEISTSPDGTTWTLRRAANSTGNRGITDIYYDGSSRWVFVTDADSNGPGEIWSSTDDGVNWTRVYLGTGTERLLSVAYGSGLWVAVGQQDGFGAGGQILSSSDGVSWSRVHTTGASLFAVARGTDSWVAVGERTPTAGVHTSPDGTTWTDQTPPTQDTTWRGLATNGTPPTVTPVAGGWIVGSSSQ